MLGTAEATGAAETTSATMAARIECADHDGRRSAKLFLLDLLLLCTLMTSMVRLNDLIYS